MTRSKLNQAQRRVYLAQRTIGDLRALERGRLTERVVKRTWHRKLIGLLRRGGLW